MLDVINTDPSVVGQTKRHVFTSANVFPSVCLRLHISFCSFKLHISTKDDTKERASSPNKMLSMLRISARIEQISVVKDETIREKRKSAKFYPFYRTGIKLDIKPVQKHAWLHAWLKIRVMSSRIS